MRAFVPLPQSLFLEGAFFPPLLRHLSIGLCSSRFTASVRALKTDSCHILRWLLRLPDFLDGRRIAGLFPSLNALNDEGFTLTAQ